MSRQAIVKCTLLGAVSALWIGVIVACGHDEPAANQDQQDTPEPTKEPAPEATKERPAPPPTAPPAADACNEAARADGGGATAAAPACGHPGEPMCPLQEYMKRTMLPAMRSGQGIEESFTKIRTWAPDPSYDEGPNGWRATAESGAQAIKAGTKAGAQAACKACHTAWQKRYRADFRQRPLPTQ